MNNQRMGDKRRKANRKTLEKLAGKIATISCEIPEITNLFLGDDVEILKQKKVGKEPLTKMRIYIRSMIRRGVEGWINGADVFRIRDRP